MIAFLTEIITLLITGQFPFSSPLSPFLKLNLTNFFLLYFFTSYFCSIIPHLFTLLFFIFFPLLFYLIFLLYFCTLFFTLFFYTLLFTLLFYLTFLPYFLLYFFTLPFYPLCFAKFFISSQIHPQAKVKIILLSEASFPFAEHRVKFSFPSNLYYVFVLSVFPQLFSYSPLTT